MPHHMWLVIGVLLCVVGGYWAVKNRDWFWFVVASIALFYAVPNLVTVLA